MFAKNWWEVVVMEKQDLRKFKRKDLLELLLKQATRIKELEDEIIEINKELESKKINIKENLLSIILIGGIAIISIILVFALYIIINSPDFDKEKLYFLLK